MALWKVQKLQESADETVRYELDEGNLLLTPSPTLWRNIVAFRIAGALREFVEAHNLGLVVLETDFRLLAAVRRPGVAFIAKENISQLDLHHSPVQGAPTLAIAANAKAVWLVYPDLSLIQIHDPRGTHEVTEPDSLEEDRLFVGAKFSLSLTTLFDQNPEH